MAPNYREEEEMAKLMKPGVRVVRGKDWKYGNDDGNGPGLVVEFHRQGRRRLSKSGWAIRPHLFWFISIPTPIKIKKYFENLSKFIGFFKFKFRII